MPTSLGVLVCLRNNITQAAGEWFNGGPKAIINQALQTGGGPNASDAFTINGLSGSLYNRSAKGMKQWI